MNMNIKKLREGIWELFEFKIQEMFVNMEDEEEELGDDLSVNVEIGMYAGAATWKIGDDNAAMLIAVYPSGSVDIILDESCHKEKRICLSKKLGNTAAEIEKILDDISNFIDVFLEGNWHEFMDFVCRNDDWRAAIVEYQANCDVEANNVTYICS